MAEHQVTTAKQINAMLRDARTRDAEMMLRSRIHRMLVERDKSAIKNANYTGTVLPDPFSKTQLAIRSMVGEPAQAAIHYASRFSANPPVPEVTPFTVKDKVTARIDKLAGQQEMFDAQLLEEMGIRKAQWSLAMAQALTDAGYYLVLPRDMGFGVPTREYYSDEEAEVLRAEGKVAPVPVQRNGQRMYAEHADAWHERRREAAQYRAINGLALFTLEVFPRDMVHVWRDIDGIKAAAVVSEIAASECGPGSELAMHMARKAGTPEDDVKLYGLWRDKQGNIVGGIERGGPPQTGWTRTGSWTLVRFFNRIEAVYMISSSGSADGAREVYRANHGCKVKGNPACPVVEVPCMQLDTSVNGHEFIGPMSSVYAYASLVNQLMTLLSNAAVYNGTPRWVVEGVDGQIIRDSDGKPVIVDSAPVPGLDPSQAATYPGTLRQLKIEDDGLLSKLLEVYLQQLAMAMPSPSATGNAGEQSAAWLAQTNIQQHQLTLQQPIQHHVEAVEGILWRCHEWLRALGDTPVCFFPPADYAGEGRGRRGLIEFNPQDLTDAISVTQSLETPDEAIIRDQMGLEKRAAGVIDDREYFEDYARKQDPREAEIRMWAQKFKTIAMTGSMAEIPPDSLLYTFVQQVRGRVHYQLLQESPQYALNTARQMADQANQQAQMQQQASQQEMAPPGSEAPNVANTAGIARPGMGMADTLQQQLGAQAQPPPADMGLMS